MDFFYNSLACIGVTSSEINVKIGLQFMFKNLESQLRFQFVDIRQYNNSLNGSLTQLVKRVIRVRVGLFDFIIISSSKIQLKDKMQELKERFTGKRRPLWKIWQILNDLRS